MAVLLTLVAACDAGAVPSPSELIARLQATESAWRLRHIATSSVQENRLRVQGSQDRVTYVRLRTEFWTDGAAMELSSEMWNPLARDAETPPNQLHRSRMLWDGATFYEYHVPRGADASVSFLARMKGARERAWRVITNARLDAPLDGEGLGNQQPLAAVLGEAETKRVRPEVDRVGEAQCFVIEATSSRYGSYVLWIDPDRGYRIVKAVVRKSGDNYNEGIRLSDDRRNGPRDPRAITLNIDNVELARVAGRWIVRLGDIDRVAELRGGGGSYSVHIHCSRTAIDMDEASTRSALRPSFPDGTRVFDDELGSAIRWKWHDGEVVPAVDTRAVGKSIDETLVRFERPLPLATGGTATKSAAPANANPMDTAGQSHRRVLLYVAFSVLGCAGALFAVVLASKKLFSMRIAGKRR